MNNSKIYAVLAFSELLYPPHFLQVKKKALSSAVMDEIQLNRIAGIAFVALTLFFGLRVKRAKTLQEYALAGRSLGTGAVLITLAATLLSSRSIWLRGTFRTGSTVMMLPIAASIAIMLVGWYFFPKLLAFRKQYTVGGVMQQLYGQKTAQATSLLSVLASIFVIAAQFAAAGGMADMFKLPRTQLILILGTMITLYTFFGSMRSVASTDIFQLLCILGGTLAFVLFSLYNGKSILEENSVFSKHSDFWNQKHPLRRYLFSPLFWSLWPTLVVMPPVIQRVLMLRKEKTIKTTFFGVSLINLVFTFFFFLVAIHVAKCYTQESSNSKSISTQKLLNLACNNPIGKTAFLLVLFSILISTIDSFLHSASVELALFCQRARALRIQEKQVVQWSTGFTLLLGSVSTAITVIIPQIGTEEIMAYAIIVYAILVIPFLAGLWGLKGNDKIFILTFSTYLLTFLFLFLTLDTNTVLDIIGGKGSSKSPWFHKARFCWLPAILASTVIFFVAHYLTYGHFVIIRRDKNKLVRERKHTLDFTWLTSPAKWAEQKAKQYGMHPYALGVFLYLSLMVPYLYLGETSNQEGVLTTIFILRSIGGILVTLLLLESLWPKDLCQRFFPLFYYSTVFYCVPFLAVMTTYYDPNGGFSVSNIVLAIILLILLVDWRTFVGFFCLATLLSSLYYKCVQGSYMPAFNKDQGFVLMMNVLYSLFVCLIFARKKQLSSYLKNKRFTKSKERSESRLYVQRGVHTQLAMAVDARSSIMQEAQTIADKLQGGVVQKEDGHKLAKVIAYLSDLQKKSMEHLPLEPSSKEWKKVIKALLEDLETLQLEDKVDILLHLKQDKAKVTADISHLQRLLLNALQHMVKYYPSIDIHCHIDAVTLNYEAHEKAKARTIPAYRITITEEATPPAPATYDSSYEIPHLEKDTKHLTENYHITIAHYGSMSYQQKGTTCVQTYVIPCNVHEVRPKITQLTDEDLTQRTTIRDPEDIAFLQKATNNRHHMPTVEKALKVCKHYHRHQKRKSGEPYYLHPVAVATILLDYTKDTNVLVAGLLHDILEDTAYTSNQMVASFGTEVNHIVSEVSNIYNKANRKHKLTKREKYAEMLATADPRILLVKLADRLHNMRTLAALPKPKRIKIVQETLDFFKPIAHHLGYQAIEEELTALCATDTSTH